MHRPLLIVLTAILLLAISALAIMNNACKSSQHQWCAPMSALKHHIKAEHRDASPAKNVEANSVAATTPPHDDGRSESHLGRVSGVSTQLRSAGEAVTPQVTV
jgi:hypothetical protein